MNTFNTTVIFTLRNGNEIKHESFFDSPKAAHNWVADIGEQHDANAIFSDKEIVGYTFTFSFPFQE